MKPYTDSELKEILRLHRLWLDGEPNGVRANLSGANLSGANLSWTALLGANLSEANLSEANLLGANLSGANLSWTALRGADLRRANLSGANLWWTNLNWADLDWADLSQIKGIKTFRHGRHQAIQYRDRIRIGCENHTINFWLENYESVGQANKYTPGQIEAYGEFIKQCAKEMN